MSKKFGFALLVLLALVTAGTARAVVITVNTTVDEDNVLYGGTDHGCSLREAVRAAALKQSYGGCPAGSGTGDVIQLGAGPYYLTPDRDSGKYGPIVVSSGVSIQGASTTDNPAINPLTGSAPTQTPPTTVIDMQSDGAGSGLDMANLAAGSGNSRVFILTAKSAVTFQDLIIEGGFADDSQGTDIHDNNNYGGNGGAIWAASSVAMANVLLMGNQATGSGGAVFLTGAGTGLNVAFGTFSKNKAYSGGGAIATTCYNSLALESHSITLAQSLVFGNRTTRNHTDPYGAVMACGNATESINDSTISGNDIGLSMGNTAAATLGLTPAGVAMELTHVTLIGQSVSGIDISTAQLSKLTLLNSVIAFNYPYGTDPSTATPAGSTVPYSNCYQGSVDTGTIGTFSINGSVFGDYCGLGSTQEKTALTGGGVSSTGISNPNWANQFFMPFGSSVNPLSQPPLTYGGLTGAYFPKSSAVDANAILVDAIASGCDSTDQRGVSRNAGDLGCTLGAIEPKILLPQNDSASNGSGDGAARTVVAPVLSNDTGDEDGSVVGGNLDGIRYAVAGIASFQCDYGGNGGRVTMSADATKLVYAPPRPVVNGVAQPGQGTLSTSPVTCYYQVYDNRTPNPNASTLSAKVTMTVADLPPVAKSVVYTRPYSGDPFYFDPLSVDTDPDSVTGKLPDSGPARDSSVVQQLRPQDCAARQLVKIINQPSLGTVSGVGGPSARVLSGTSIVNYYDGHLVYQTYNSFSPFSDSFTYQVLDADCVASNTATVTIKVDAPPAGGGRGGSLDGLLVAGLGVLAGLRRKRRS